MENAMMTVFGLRKMKKSTVKKDTSPDVAFT